MCNPSTLGEGCRQGGPELEAGSSDTGTACLKTKQTNVPAIQERRLGTCVMAVPSRRVFFREQSGMLRAKARPRRGHLLGETLGVYTGTTPGEVSSFHSLSSKDFLDKADI